MAEESTPPESGKHRLWTLTLLQEEFLSLEEYDALVTFPIRGGREATALFPSAEAADSVLSSIRRNNPNMKVEVISRSTDWLIGALEYRVDIDSIVTNASAAVAGGEGISSVSRRRFIEMLREGGVAEALGLD